jgi:hypothetical protein
MKRQTEENEKEWLIKEEKLEKSVEKSKKKKKSLIDELGLQPMNGKQARL